MVGFSQIEQFAGKIVQEYHPHRVVLFGSHARGAATEDSDVDLLIVLPFEGKSVQKSAEMRLKLRPSFAVDLLVKTPETIQQRLAMGDTFIEDILKNGKVIYEADHN